MGLIDADYLREILLHNYHGNNKNIVPYSDRKGYRLRDREVNETIINAPTVQAISISDNATNGDVIKYLYPNGTESFGRKNVYYSFNPDGHMEFTIDWWNTKYERR